MSWILMPKAQSSPGAKPAQMRKAGTGQRHGRLAKMCFGVVAVGVLITAVAMVAMVFIPLPPPKGRESGVSPPNRTVSELSSCTPAQAVVREKSFNNQTGQISDRSSQCPSDVVLDARGMPVPIGTLHTLNSISKSFK